LVDLVSYCFKLAGMISVLVLLSLPAEAQSYQTWPEISTYRKLNSDVRLYFIATTTRENSKGTSAEIGPSIDFYLKPLLRQEKITIFQVDKSKSSPLLRRLGYRYLPSTDGPAEHRGALEATGRLPLMSSLLVSDRSRSPIR